MASQQWKRVPVAQLKLGMTVYVPFQVGEYRYGTLIALPRPRTADEMKAYEKMRRTVSRDERPACKTYCVVQVERAFLMVATDAILRPVGTIEERMNFPIGMDDNGKFFPAPNETTR